MTETELQKHCTHCGTAVPCYNVELPKDIEERVRQLIRNGSPVTAILELKRLATLSLGEAKHWVDHCGEMIGHQTGPCPFCGKELRTERSKQCRFCLRDWHDPDNLRSL